jgi:hypothetical protein
MSDKFRFLRGHLAEDVRGHYVSMPYRGRTLLGEVRSVDYNTVTGHYVLGVRHFNGSPWPINPTALSVDVIRQSVADYVAAA